MRKYLPELFATKQDTDEQPSDDDNQENSLSERVNIVIPVDEVMPLVEENDPSLPFDVVETQDAVDNSGDGIPSEELTDLSLVDFSARSSSNYQVEEGDPLSFSTTGGSLRQERTKLDKKKEFFYDSSPEQLAKMMRTSISKDEK